VVVREAVTPGDSSGGRKVRLIDLPIPIRSSDCIDRYNWFISSSNFGISTFDCTFFLGGRGDFKF
jgi:hypothetical protein